MILRSLPFPEACFRTYIPYGIDFDVSIDAVIPLTKQKQLECGPMPNVMVALPNIGGALCSTPQSLADAHY